MKDVKVILSKLGKNITQVSSDIVKNTKLSIKLSTEEDKLNKIYIEIGKKVHEIHSYGGSVGEFFDKKYKEVLSIEKSISDIKQKIEENKANRENANSTFSNNPQNNPQSNPQNAEEQLFLICSSCNEKNDINANFCIKCGRSI